MFLGAKTDISIGVGGSGSSASYTAVITEDDATTQTGIRNSNDGFGQSFTAPSNFNLGRFATKMFRNGDATITGTMSAVLYSTSSGAADTALATSTNAIDVAALPGTAPADFNAIWTFDSIALTSGTVYAVGYTIGTVVASGAYLMTRYGQADNYASGAYQFTTDSGSTWTAHASSWDAAFRVDQLD